jgi:hypothetical protein
VPFVGRAHFNDVQIPVTVQFFGVQRPLPLASSPAWTGTLPKAKNPLPISIHVAGRE